METFYTTTIEVGLTFDDYINQFDSSLDFVNLDELLNTNQNHGINAYAPSLLLTQLVNNFILLFPILYTRYGGTGSPSSPLFFSGAHCITRITPSTISST